MLRKSRLRQKKKKKMVLLLKKTCMRLKPFHTLYDLLHLLIPVKPFVLKKLTPLKS